MKERINQIMQTEGLNASQFAETIGIQRAAMSHITSGRNNPSLDVITKVLEHFPNINPDWLLFGNGQMFRNTSATTQLETSDPDLFATNVRDSAISVSEKKETINPSTDNFVNQKTQQESNTPTKIVFGEEINERNEVKKSSVNAQLSEKETAILKNTEERKIEKILVFYSDNTYESFER